MTAVVSERREHDFNHFIDVSDNQHDVNRKHKSHSDGSHHQPIDEEEDTISESVTADLTPEEVEELFTGESKEHKQYDPDVYGDIHEFKTFYDKRIHDDEMSRRFGDDLWDTEEPDDDDPNLHVHTHLMNNYNPAEHTGRVELRNHKDSRPFIQSDDEVQEEHSDHKFTDEDLHNKASGNTVNHRDKDMHIDDPSDISLVAEQMHQGNIVSILCRSSSTYSRL